METQIGTARELLAKIERRYFKGAGLAKASRLEGDERRAYRLAQVERLLKVKHGALSMAMRLSDSFWTADECRLPIDEANPLLSPKVQEKLTDRETDRLRMILEVAGLCHDLSLHFTFDLKEAFGIKNDFWVKNRQLVEWLATTEYERTVMHVAYIMRKHAISVYEGMHYMPAQDEMAELFSSEYRELVRDPDLTNIPPRAYVETIVDKLLDIERHWQRGRRLKLRPDLVILHDEIYGVVPRQFDKRVLQAAQALYDYMDKEVQGRGATAEVMRRFADKVREVRAEYLAEGWLTNDSLAFAYLMAHAQNCSYGIWREEDDAL